MQFCKNEAEIYIPDGCKNALARTTDLCVGAHQDDVEIMAYAPISACYNDPDRHFSAVIVTDGAGSPRNGAFSDCTDDDMKKIRVSEQKKAADVGRYSALVQLGYKSSEVKDKNDFRPVNELSKILLTAKPKNVYIHSFADKHDTHVASALRTLCALRAIRNEYKPEKLFMLEAWRGHDWLCNEDKTLLDASMYPDLAEKLLDVFESQIAGGKRYDLAAIGRRYANATFFESHSTDDISAVTYALDATELIGNDKSPEEFIKAYIDRFKNEVSQRLLNLG